MRWYCISNDADVLTGMRLAGIDGVMAHTAAEVDAAEGIAVLIVTEGCYKLCRERLDAIKLSAGRPLVNMVADSRGAGRISGSITRLIREAIGIRL